MNKIYYNKDDNEVLIITPDRKVIYYKREFFPYDADMPNVVYYTAKKSDKENVHIIVERINGIARRNIPEYGKMFELSREAFRRLFLSLKKYEFFYRFTKIK